MESTNEPIIATCTCCIPERTPFLVSESNRIESNLNPTTWPSGCKTSLGASTPLVLDVEQQGPERLRLKRDAGSRLTWWVPEALPMEQHDASQVSRPALSSTQQHERFEYMGELCWEGGLPSWTPFQGAASNIYTTVHVATPRNTTDDEPLTPDDEMTPPRVAGGGSSGAGGAPEGRGRAASDADGGNGRRRTISLGAAPSANSAILPGPGPGPGVARALAEAGRRPHVEVASTLPAAAPPSGAAITRAATGATATTVSGKSTTEVAGDPGAATTLAENVTALSLVPPPALLPPTSRMARQPGASGSAAGTEDGSKDSNSELQTPRQQQSGWRSTRDSPRSAERTPESRTFPAQPATDARHARDLQRRGRMSRRRQRQRQRAAAASLRKLRVLRQVIASEHFAHAVLLARRRQPHAHSLDIPVVCRKTTGSDKGRQGTKRIGGPDGIFVACGRACDWADGVASRVLNGECEVFAIRLTTTAGIKHSASGRRNSRSAAVSNVGPGAQVEAPLGSSVQSTTDAKASAPTSEDAPSIPVSNRSRACSAPSLRSLSDSFADTGDYADTAQQHCAPARPQLSRAKTHASGPVDRTTPAAEPHAVQPETTSTTDTQLVQRVTEGGPATSLLNIPLLVPASHDDIQRAKVLETVRPPSPPAVSIPSNSQAIKLGAATSDEARTNKRPILNLKVKTPSLPIPLRPLPKASASSATTSAPRSVSTAPGNASSGTGATLSSESVSKPAMKWRPRHLRVGAGLASKSSSCTSLEGLLKQQEAVEATAKKGKAEEQKVEITQHDDGTAERTDSVCSPCAIKESSMARSERGRSDSITAFAARQRMSTEPISTRLKFGASAEKGNRSSMEDEHVMLENLECYVIQQWERRAPGSSNCYPWRALCTRPGSPTVDTAAIAAVAVPQGNIVGAPSDSALGAEVVARAAADAQAAEKVLETAAEATDVEAEPRWLCTLRRRASDVGSRVSSRAPSPDDHTPQKPRSAQSSAGATATASEPQSPQTPRGRRQHAFFGVFDGHDGREAVEYVSARLPFATVRSRHFPKRPKKALVEAFFETDSELLKLAAEHEWYSGTTAVVVLISGDVLLTAHAGDSRLVLGTSRPGKGGFIELTKDHKPDRPDERARIERAGGSVTVDCDGCVRVGDVLSVARSFGDWEKDHRFHDPKTSKLLGITAEPEVGEFVLDDADEFLICACDGLWDVMQNKQAIDFCRKSLQRHGDPRRASRELSAQALRQGSTDNVSVVVVSFIERPGFRWGGGADAEPLSARRLRNPNEPGSGGGSTSSAAVVTSSCLFDGSIGGSGDCAVDSNDDSHDCEGGVSDAAAIRPRPTRGALSAVQAAISVAGLPATPVNRSDDDE